MEQDFKELLERTLQETGAELDQAVDEVALYMADRTAHLSTLVGQPGFQEAVIAERDNVAMFAGLLAVDLADATDARIVGVIQGALAMAAKGLARLA